MSPPWSTRPIALPGLARSNLAIVGASIDTSCGAPRSKPGCSNRAVTPRRGTSVWAGQFLGSAGEAREQIKRNLLFKLRTAFMDVEAARLSTLPLSALNVQDLLLKARAAINHQPTPARSAENIATLERALGLDPNSAEVMITLAFRY